MEIRTHFIDENDVVNYISQCEKRFEKQMDNCLEKLKNRENLKFITLSGPTCSGKTTASHIITRELENEGYELTVISIDDYFIDRDILNSRHVLDYDSIDTIDLELFSKNLSDLKNDRVTELPVFDFVSGKRTGFKKHEPLSHEIIIFEGIQAVYGEISSLFDKKDTVSIYISVEDSMKLCGNIIDARTQRLLRRLSRDTRTRGTTTEFTLTLWESVSANEDKNILPNAGSANIKLNSLLGYELSVLKNILIPLFDTIDVGSVHYDTAKKLKTILESVQPIDEKYVPKDSLFCEFIPK